MTALFDYPKTTVFGRVVSKNRIYDHAGASSTLKDLFVHEVDQIVWANKLAPETINLPPTKSVTEIQIFHVALKTGDLSDEVLRAVDRAIPFPLVFELNHGSEIQVAAAHKRPSEADSTKWVVSEHLRSPWYPDTTSRQPLPLALSMGALYEQILSALIPLETDAAEGIAVKMARLARLAAKEREIGKLRHQLKRETQFNIKVTILSQLQEALATYEQMKRPGETGGGN